MTATASVRIAHQDHMGFIKGSQRPIVSHLIATTTSVSAKQMTVEARMNCQKTSKYRPSSTFVLIHSTAQVPKVMKSIVGIEMVNASKQARANFFQRGAS